MSERRTKITTWWSPEANGYLLRAHYWGAHGYSTQTCLSEGEARSFFVHCDTRKPKRNRKPHEQNRD